MDINKHGRGLGALDAFSRLGLRVVVLHAAVPLVLGKQAGDPAMSGRALVDRIIAAHNGRDDEALSRCYAPTASVVMDGWETPLDVVTWLAVVDAVDESFPDLVLTRVSVATGEGLVMAEIRMTGTNTAPCT